VNCDSTWLCLPSPWFAIALIMFTITLVDHRFGLGFNNLFDSIFEATMITIVGL